MSINSLIFRIAKDYGITALGEGLGINQNTFKNKVNPNLDTHHVYAHELDLIATIADTDGGVMEGYVTATAILFTFFGFGLSFGLCLIFSGIRSNRVDQVDLPGLESVRVLCLGSGDILVVKFAGVMRPEIHSSLKEQLSNILPPGIRTMIISEGLDIDSILRCGSSDIKEGNTDANNSNQNPPEPSPLSEVKLNDDTSK